MSQVQHQVTPNEHQDTPPAAMQRIVRCHKWNPYRAHPLQTFDFTWEELHRRAATVPRISATTLVVMIFIGQLRGFCHRTRLEDLLCDMCGYRCRPTVKMDKRDRPDGAPLSAHALIPAEYCDAILSSHVTVSKTGPFVDEYFQDANTPTLVFELAMH